MFNKKTYMKKNSSFISLFILLVSIFFFAFIQDKPKETIKIGDKAPLTDVKMANIDNKMFNLEDIKKEKGILVMFSCNTCPFVIAWEDRYPELGEICKINNIGFAIINSNEAKRDGEDSFDEMKKHANEKNYNTYYLIDKASQLANAFGAKTTPHVFLFNSQFELVYKGAIDDNFENKNAVKEHYLKNALEQLSIGEKITKPETKAIGCSIKRVAVN